VTTAPDEPVWITVDGQEQEAPNWNAASVIGVVLFPVACLAVTYAAFGAASWLLQIAHASDLSSKRKSWETTYVVVVGLIPLGVMAFVWFDVLKLKTPRRKRLALLGYVGLAIGGLAVAALLPGARLRY
jgi:nitrate reductase NapE component